MAAALCDAAALQDGEHYIWQLALWPPDKAVPFVRLPRTRHLRIVQTVLAPVVALPIPPARTSGVELQVGAFACTWPGCDRGPQQPFLTTARLANHRFAAHGIRSSNEESIARQRRRDKKRAAATGAPPPEYIDPVAIRGAVHHFLPMNLPAPTRSGALDPGDYELLRRRLCYFVTHEWMRELRRAPGEIVVALAHLAARGLVPARLLDEPKSAERTMDALTALFGDRSAAGSRV